MDMKSAFVHGDIKEEIYIDHLKGMYMIDLLIASWRNHYTLSSKNQGPSMLRWILSFCLKVFLEFIKIWMSTFWDNMILFSW